MNRPYKKPEARSKIPTCCIKNVQIQLVGDRVFLNYHNPTKDTVIHLETQIISCYETGEYYNEILERTVQDCNQAK